MESLKLVFNMLIFPGGLFAILFGLLLAGIDRKLYARLQRRVGPPIYQPVIDTIKLLQKEILIPRTANYIAFRLAPLMGFIGMLTAAALIPVTGVYSGTGKFADLLVILYLLATPALSLMIGASASGSPYSAIGLSREMTMTIAYEIPMLMVFLTEGIKVGMANGVFADFSLIDIMNYQLKNGSLLFDVTMLPGFFAFLCCIPGAIGVVPFDIPEAETEITEGPILEFSGTSLAMFKLTGSLKMVVVSALAVALFFPAPLCGLWPVDLLWFIFKCIVITIVSITIVRATRARMRIDQAFSFYLIVPLALALVSLILALLHIGL